MELEQVFLLIFTYGSVLYVSFGKGVGTIALGALLLVLSFFVLLHQLIGFSYNFIYMMSFLILFIISILSILKTKGSDRIG